MNTNNKCFFLGRLTADPDIRYSQNGDTSIARFTLAVNRRFKRESDPSADFVSMVAFGKVADNIEKYFTKGSQILVETHYQQGEYTNRDGQKVRTHDFIVDGWEFTSGASGTRAATAKPEKPEEKPKQGADEFANIPENIGEELPWD